MNQRVALITGASQGLGLALAEALRSAGADVVTMPPDAAVPDLGGVPAADPTGDASGDPFSYASGDVSRELGDGPSAYSERPGAEAAADAAQSAAESGDEATQAPGVVEPPRAVEALPDADLSHSPAEPSPTVDQRSRDAVEELADLNGDRTEAEPEDDVQLDQGESTDPGRKRRRGLFRRGGT